jgi:hypothetical protein
MISSQRQKIAKAAKDIPLAFSVFVSLAELDAQLAREPKLRAEFTRRRNLHTGEWPVSVNGARASRSERFAKGERTADARIPFCLGEGMNRLIGVFCLRLLVGFISVVVAAVLLFASNHADAQAPPGIGIMYLENSDAVGDPIHDWTDDPALTNPFVQGIALRTQWGRVEPHEHANAEDFYWDFLDQGVALCAAHGKKVSILITAGVSCPQWLFDAGSPAFNVTTQSGYSAVTDGVTTAGSTTVISAGDTAGWKTSLSVGLQIFGGSIPAGATIVTVNSSSNVTISAPATASATGVAITTAQILPMPLPWDPIFQQKWGAFVQAFAARYGNSPNLAYVVMGGPGRREEAYFCFTSYDIDYFINTLGGLPNWERGVKWIIDQYATYFPNTPFMLAMADPIPTTDGDNSLKTVVNYGVAQHPGNHFGVMSCGLQYPDGPGNGTMGATEIPLLSPTSTVGYQFLQTQHEDIDPATGRFMLDLGLERGFNFGAHFIEVYSGDCNDPVLAPVLTTWGALLTSYLGNISTRALVQTANNVMIGGFIVQGTGPKTVIIRAIGPELISPPYNIPNALADPTLELHNSTGALIGSNNNWQTTVIGGVITSSQVSAIQNSGHAPTQPSESAIIATLQPGNYTAIVRGVNNTVGVALVEVYDLAPDATSILGNISTRALVQTANNVMIGGFIVQGTGPKRVIIRAIGPELTQYGIADALANPTLELHNAAGALIGSNDNWQTTIIGGIITSNQVSDIQTSGHVPTDASESAIIADLAPGNYTAIVRGVSNTTGVALVEVYDLD